MFQLPLKYRKELAELPEIKSPKIRKLLRMSDEALDETLAVSTKKLKEAGHSDRVVRAYQTVAPLMLENKAILKFLRIPGNWDLSSVLKDVATPQEAANLAVLEYRLSIKEVDELLPMLEEDLT